MSGAAEPSARPPALRTTSETRGPAAVTAARVVSSIPSADPVLVLADEAALDACRRVALRIRTALAQAGSRSVAVVSAVRGEGKTTVTCDLAIAMASLCKEGEVALVDLDLRNPSIARRLGLEVEVGIEQYLSGDTALDELRVVVQRPSLEIYPIAAPAREAHELLVSGRFTQLIRELEARHAVVLIDTPASLVASDTAIILERVASCILLARAGVTRMRNFRQLVASLPRHKVIGEVMNAARPERHRYYDYYHAEGVGTGRASDPGEGAPSAP